MLTMILMLVPMLATSMSPLTISLTVVVFSMALSSQLYSNFTSLFPAMAMIISFSSGMMILFCYCSIMVNYEESKKSMKSKMVTVIAAVMVIMLSQNASSWSDYQKNEMSTNLQNYSLMWMMGVVIIAMVCINKTMYYPNKPLMSSY